MTDRQSHSILGAAWRKACCFARTLHSGAERFAVVMILSLLVVLEACEREPHLHLHRGSNIDIDIPVVDLELNVYWDYELVYGIDYDWEAEWFYGWDEYDRKVFGEIGYTEPSKFILRRYFTGSEPYRPHTQVEREEIYGKWFHGNFDWGFWDILVWNDIKTLDGVQSLYFDERQSLDYVIAGTNQTMHSTRYQAPKYTRAFYEPEPLFAGYTQALEINKELDGFEFDPVRNVWVKQLDMQLEPATYIYLTQVILHHNNGKIIGVDGSANLSGMARNVNLNTGIAGSDAVTVHYNVLFKNNCDMEGEKVDIAGGRLLTFGMCNINANRVQRASEIELTDDIKHYMDVNMLFNNGMDSTFVFDVTDQVRQRFKGGVLTIELDMDSIAVPSRKGGSGFDAVVKDYEDGGTYEFPM